MSQKYDSYGGETQSYDNVEFRFTPKSTVDATLTRAFGTGSEYGQSLGVNFEDVAIEDGGLYYYPDGDYYKLFSWEEITGFMPGDAYERGNTPTADDADEVLNKTYFGDTNVYELVAARVPEGDDWEASSRGRELEGVDDGVPQFSDWTDHDGDTVSFGDNVVSWWDGTEEYGPSTAATSLLENITQYGSGSIVDEDDLYNWLPDTSGDNILRDDLEGREVEFFLVPKEGDSGNVYYDPIVEDKATGERVQPNNRGGGSGNASSSSGSESESGESQLVSDAREQDAASRSYPEPLADFISSAGNLEMTPDRANDILDDLVGDQSNGLTEAMIDDEFGGRGALIEQVV